MKVADIDKFREEMIKDIATPFKQQHWELKDINPHSIQLLDSVWDMSCKRQITKGEVYKYKSCLNDNGMDMYAPVVTWFEIRSILTIVLLHKGKYPDSRFFPCIPTS